MINDMMVNLRTQIDFISINLMQTVSEGISQFTVFVLDRLLKIEKN